MTELKVNAGEMRLLSGRLFNFITPDPALIDINDIAAGLAYKAHFSGQIPNFFSIAEHSTLCVDLLPKNSPALLKLTTLLHDASEAYLGDMIKPLKIMMPDFGKIEAVLQKAIFLKFDAAPDYLFIDLMHRVKLVDKESQVIEYNCFYNSAIDARLKFYSPDLSKWVFIKYFNDIMAELKLNDNGNY